MSVRGRTELSRGKNNLEDVRKILTTSVSNRISTDDLTQEQKI